MRLGLDTGWRLSQSSGQKVMTEEGTGVKDAHEDNFLGSEDAGCLGKRWQ